jgi:parallel beta-helix repeat protein
VLIDLNTYYEKEKPRMYRKTVSAMLLSLLFLGILLSAFNIQPVKASGTIYIRPDGNIDPGTAPIERDGNTYMLRGNITDEISVRRDNIVVDGQSYTLQRASGTGITLEERSNVTITNINIKLLKSPCICIFLRHASNNTVCANNMTASDIGIYLQMNCTGNRIYGNNITNGKFGPGIEIYDYSSNNIISGNTIADNFGGISFLDGNSNNSVIGNNIVNNRGYNIPGIALGRSSGNSIIGNNIANNSYHGVQLSGSSDNSIVGNNIVDNGFYGLWLGGSSNNSIVGNNISNNQFGIYLYVSRGNGFFHNNLINNTSQIPTGQMYPSGNVWDDGLEGNHWSDYNGTDANEDGIGDTPYVIDSNNTDHCPLMGMFHGFTITWQEKTYPVIVISNSTVSDQIGYVITSWINLSTHSLDQASFEEIYFYVSGHDGTRGFCRVYIPAALLNGTYRVFVNTTEVLCTLLPGSNSTDSYLYFTYAHSTERVRIVPEFPSPLVILHTFMIATLLAVVVYRRKRLSASAQT